MPRFFIQRVRFRPAGEERPDTPHAGYDCIISPVEVTGDPAIVHVRYEQLQPLLELWKLDRPIELMQHQFDAPERCRDPQEAFEHLLDLVGRKMDPELIQPGWYRAHVAQALADLRCPRFDAVQLAGCERFFGGAFGQDGELNHEWLAMLAAEVAHRSQGTVTIEEADELEFTTHPPKPVAYLVVARGDERLWLILRPWPNGIPLISDEDIAREGVVRPPSRDPSPEAQLLDLYNEQYARVFASAQSKGENRVAALKRDVTNFFSGSTGLVELFQGLSIEADGVLDVAAVLANLDRIQAAQRLRLLQQGLSELLDFLLFSAMESMDSASQTALERRVDELLREGGETEPRSPTVSTSLELLDVFSIDDDGAPVGDALVGPPEEDPPLDDAQRVPMSLEEHNRLAKLFDEAPPSLPPGFRGLPPPPPLPPSPSPGFEIPGPRNSAASVALVAFSTAEAEANFAIEELEQLAQQAQDDGTREVALRAIEHIRTALRELQTLHGRLFPQTHRALRR
ncbi:MAG: hypothetical protein Q7R80_03300 [bacterium]|nr:hypothetical protein [bacterium]